MAPNAHSTSDDEMSVETELQAKPVKNYDCEFEKQADAYLKMIGGYLGPYWAVASEKAKEIDGEYKVSEALISAKGAVEAKIAELTKKEEEEEKQDAEEPVKEEKEWEEVQYSRSSWEEKL